SLPIPRPPTPTLFPYTTLFRSEVPTIPPNPLEMLDLGRVRISTDSEEKQIRVPDDGIDRGADLVTHSREKVGFSAARFLRSLPRSEEHTSELQSRENLVCRLLL